MWNWQWDCPDAAPPPAAPDAATVCINCNIAIALRIASPGDDGDVTQSISAVAMSTASNMSSERLTDLQLAPAAPAPDPLPPPAPPPLLYLPPYLLPLPSAPLPPTPPEPVVVTPPFVFTSGAGQRGLSDGAGATVLETNQDPPRRGGEAFVAALSSTHVLAVTHARRGGRSSVHVEARAWASSQVSVVQVERTQVERTVKRSAKAAVRVRPESTAPNRLPPAPPPSPSPSAGALTASGSHGSGSFVVAATLGAAAGLAIIALLSGLVPLSVLARRRLSDDRRSRPG